MREGTTAASGRFPDHCFFKGATTHLGESATGTEIAGIAAIGGNPVVPAIPSCGSHLYPHNRSSVIPCMQIKSIVILKLIYQVITLFM
jgi:hypothetical protein